MEKWIMIVDNESFIVEFNVKSCTYRVSYFEDGHFKDDVCFVGQIESEYKAVEIAKSKTWTTEELQKEPADLLKPPYIGSSEDISFIPNACKTCPTHTSNGGNGICHCILGLAPVNCSTSASFKEDEESFEIKCESQSVVDETIKEAFAVMREAMTKEKDNG